MLIKQLFSRVLEIIFPRFCVGCNKIGTYLCYNCYETIEFITFPTTKKISSLSSITATCKYAGVCKKLIFQLKYQSIRKLSQLIAEIIFYATVLPDCQYYTYVPLHWKKRNIRGYNQSQLIANHLAKITNKPVLKLLEKNMHTQSQMSIKSKESRKENIKNSFSYVQTEQIANMTSILIIDDVFTSGATLSVCAELLKKNGWKEVHGLCFAQRS